MSELSKDELLSILHVAFAYHAPDGEAKKSNQAYNQIVALIKKEVTEEWIEGKAIKMGKIVVAFHAPGSSVRWMGNPHERCKDFIRSLIKEIK